MKMNDMDPSSAIADRRLVEKRIFHSPRAFALLHGARLIVLIAN